MKAWEKHIDDFYAKISGEAVLVYQPIINMLIELGYTPMKKQTKGLILSFSNLEQNRVLARCGIREGSENVFSVCVFRRVLVTRISLSKSYAIEFYQTIAALQNVVIVGSAKEINSSIHTHFPMAKQKLRVAHLCWKYPISLRMTSTKLRASLASSTTIS